MRYVLGIGTNVGDRKENIDKAIKAIELLPQTKIVLKSSIYETQPVGYDEQQDFYNICVEVQSIFNPYEMMRDSAEFVQSKTDRELYILILYLLKI